MFSFSFFFIKLQNLVEVLHPQWFAFHFLFKNDCLFLWHVELVVLCGVGKQKNHTIWGGFSLKNIYIFLDIEQFRREDFGKTFGHHWLRLFFLLFCFLKSIYKVFHNNIQHLVCFSSAMPRPVEYDTISVTFAYDWTRLQNAKLKTFLTNVQKKDTLCCFPVENLHSRCRVVKEFGNESTRQQLKQTVCHKEMQWISRMHVNLIWRQLLRDLLIYFFKVNIRSKSM